MLEDDWGARLKDGKCVGLVKTGTCMQAAKKQRGQNVLFQTGSLGGLSETKLLRGCVQWTCGAWVRSNC